MHLLDNVYFLEDVVKALRANSDLGFNAIDALKCPTKVQGTEVHPHKCPENNIKCELCQKQKCKQFLIVSRNNARLTILNIYFLIYTEKGSGKIGHGFVPKNDNQLKQLIDKKYIKI